MVSIAAERSSLTKVGMMLRRREQWGARFDYETPQPKGDPWPGRYKQVVEPATKQFVHITVTNPGNYNSFDAHARAIEAIGISRFPSTGISYGRLFMAGTRSVYEAQPVGRRGAHSVNDFRRSSCSLSGCPSRGTSLTAPSWNLNYNARAYAYASNVGFSFPDHVLDDMARSMAADRLAGFVTRNASIHGHRCVSAKSCPGDRVWARLGELEQRVQHYLSTGLNGDDDMPLNSDDLNKIAERTAAVLRQHDGNPVGEYNGRKISRDEAMLRGAQWAGGSRNDMKYRVLPALSELLGRPVAEVDEQALRAVLDELLPQFGTAQILAAIEQLPSAVRAELKAAL